VRFLDFPFEWDMAYNNLPCTYVQAVITVLNEMLLSTDISRRRLSARRR
jgi:hypothetical protein